MVPSPARGREVGTRLALVARCLGVGPAAAPRSLRVSCKGGRGSPELRLPPARSLLRTAKQDASASRVLTPRRAQPPRRPQVTFLPLVAEGLRGGSRFRGARGSEPQCAAPTALGPSGLGASLRALDPGGDWAPRPSPAISADFRVGAPCSERAGLGATLRRQAGDCAREGPCAPRLRLRLRSCGLRARRGSEHPGSAARPAAFT